MIARLLYAALCAGNLRHDGAGQRRAIRGCVEMLGHADIRTTQIYDRRQHKDSAVFSVKY